jgi:hypothetical protein
MIDPARDFFSYAALKPLNDAPRLDRVPFRPRLIENRQRQMSMLA